MGNREPSTSYDQVPYRSKPNPLSHPENLAMVARLLGLSTPELARCRVLEIGSGTGTNLIPIAEDLPEAQHLGIDLSERQVAMCNESVAALGLKNVRFLQMDLMDVTPELGTFDYIIAHGMYSWVPPAVRDKLLTICSENLSENGVVYMSYNVLPGWHVSSLLRDSMRYHTRNLEEPGERSAQAREFLDFLCDGITGNEGSMPVVMKSYAEYYREHLRNLGPAGESLLQHDILAGINEPVYFHAFAEDAERHGLEYIAEAPFELSRMSQLPPGPRGFLERTVGSLVEMEQYMDFLDMRLFRQSLLCKKGRGIDRALSLERLRDLFVRAEVRSVSARPLLNGSGVERFMGPDGATIATGSPVSKAALQYLGDVYPRSIPFRELMATARLHLGQTPDDETTAQDDAGTSREAQELGQLLLQTFCKRRNIVTLSSLKPQVVERVSERPVVRALARHQARSSHVVTNAHHLAVELEPLPHALVPLLDGTRDRAALIEGLLELVRNGSLKVKNNDGPDKAEAELRATFNRIIDQVLTSLLQRALIVS